MPPDICLLLLMLPPCFPRASFCRDAAMMLVTRLMLFMLFIASFAMPPSLRALRFDAAMLMSYVFRRRCRYATPLLCHTSMSALRRADAPPPPRHVTPSGCAALMLAAEITPPATLAAAIIRTPCRAERCAIYGLMRHAFIRIIYTDAMPLLLTLCRACHARRRDMRGHFTFDVMPARCAITPRHATCLI